MYLDLSYWFTDYDAMPANPCLLFRWISLVTCEIISTVHIDMYGTKEGLLQPVCTCPNSYMYSKYP